MANKSPRDEKPCGPNTFCLKVPIRDNYRFTPVLDHLKYNQPIAGLPSRKVTAVMLSYVGRRDEVCQMLQVLSHTSRAYCIQNAGLKAYLVGYPDYFVNLSEESRRMYLELE